VSETHAPFPVQGTAGAVCPPVRVCGACRPEAARRQRRLRGSEIEDARIYLPRLLMSGFENVAKIGPH